MIVNKTCMECGKQFEYDEKPGFPRKYCFSCGAEKKKSYAEKDKVPVVRPGEPVKVAENGSRPQVAAQVSKHTTMYVSYAKDIFNAMTPTSSLDPKERMETAIRLVKQARDSF